MTILLTGSTGFLGAEIAKQLQSRNLSWRRLDVRLHQIGPVHLDAVDTVIHCAGQIPGKGDEKELITTNADGTNHLLSQCQQARIRRFVYVSSMGVKFPSEYGRSKLAAEESVKRSPFEWLILRPAHIYGPKKDFEKLFQSLGRKRHRFVLGLGASPIHIVYVRDCAAAIVEAAISPRAGEIYNVVAPELSELEYIRILRKTTGTRFLILPLPLFLARKRKGKLEVEMRTSGTRIAGIADWNFVATPLDIGIRQTYDAVKSMPNVVSR
jgi:NADH dehydrogenase